MNYCCMLAARLILLFFIELLLEFFNIIGAKAANQRSREGPFNKEATPCPKAIEATEKGRLERRQWRTFLRVRLLSGSDRTGRLPGSSPHRFGTQVEPLHG